MITNEKKVNKAIKNVPKVYDKGVAEGYQLGYASGMHDGAQSEYDRFWDTYQQNGNRKLYRRAFSGYCWTEELLKPKYIIKPDPSAHQHSHANAMFEYCGQPSGEHIDATHICSMLDLSEAIRVQNLFSNAYMKNITVDLVNAENAQSAFGAGDAGSI